MYDLEASLRSPQLKPASDLFGAEKAGNVLARRHELLLTDK